MSYWKMLLWASAMFLTSCASDPEGKSVNNQVSSVQWAATIVMNTEPARIPEVVSSWNTTVRPWTPLQSSASKFPMSLAEIRARRERARPVSFDPWTGFDKQTQLWIHEVPDIRAKKLVRAAEMIAWRLTAIWPWKIEWNDGRNGRCSGCHLKRTEDTEILRETTNKIEELISAEGLVFHTLVQIKLWVLNDNGSMQMKRGNIILSENPDGSFSLFIFKENLKSLEIHESDPRTQEEITQVAKDFLENQAISEIWWVVKHG